MTIAEAAKLLNVSEKTIRRRVKNGTLPARLAGEPPRYEIAPEAIVGTNGASSQSNGQSQGAVKDVNWELAQALQSQLREKDRQIEEKDRQIRELHVLLQTSQEQMSRAMLPPPSPHRPWWKFWG